MANHKQLLRSIRSQTSLLLSDVIAVLPTLNISTLSRIENGERAKTIEVVLIYHLLFSTPFEDLIYEELKALTPVFEENTARLIKRLQGEGYTQRRNQRIRELQNALTRLTDIEAYEA